MLFFGRFVARSFVLDIFAQISARLFLFLGLNKLLVSNFKRHALARVTLSRCLLLLLDDYGLFLWLCLTFHLSRRLISILRAVVGLKDFKFWNGISVDLLLLEGVILDSILDCVHEDIRRLHMIKVLLIRTIILG